MKLSIAGIEDYGRWEEAGIRLPKYDVALAHKKTRENPKWVHFGAGNIFRIFIGGIADDLLAAQAIESGITCVETFDSEIIEKIYQPFDNLVLGVTLNVDGSTDKRVIGSLGEALTTTGVADRERLLEIARDKEVQIFSFTITEKGYGLKNNQGEFFPFIAQDIEKGPAAATSAMAVVTALLLERFQSGAAPIAVVSMDNCSHNGEILRTAVLAMGREWAKKGFVDEAFINYLSDEAKVGFPWTMIDKITPRPAESVAKELEVLGVEQMAPLVTSKNTFIAPYVNAEGPQYLVIEDQFPNGRPDFSKAGVYLTDRETVNKVERMKVTTCLNPLHTALAVYGCLLNYTLISAEMKDEDLYKLIWKIGPEEGMPVVTDPGILSPEAFVKEVINERFPNPYMPDAPQRIATDTSQKVGIRFGETIKSYVAKEGSAGRLIGIPLALAGWCRYLLGVDDEGQAFERSSDPLLDQLSETVTGIEVGRPETYTGQLKPLLSNDRVFGIDLYQAGIGELVEQLFVEELSSVGGVRKTLQKYL